MSRSNFGLRCVRVAASNAQFRLFNWGAMASLGEHLEQLEAQRFAGRQVELSRFANWMTVSDAPILALIGPRGIGKTWTMSAFARLALCQDHPCVRLDGACVANRPEELTLALTGEKDLKAAVECLNEQPPLLIIDGLEALGPLIRFLRDELLTRLDSATKVVLSSRTPLGHDWSRWRGHVQSMQLSGFSSVERRDYLRARGIREANVQNRILAAVGGYPLGLALAADLVLTSGDEALSARDWTDSVAALVNLLVPVSVDRGARRTLEAASVIRRFDEQTLITILGHPVSDDLAELVDLSLVSRSGHELVLHDEVRRVVIEELSLNSPERLTTLRRDALRYLRSRIALAEPEAAARLSGDHLEICMSVRGQSGRVEAGASGLTVVEGTPTDYCDLVELQANLSHSEFAPPPAECQPEVLRAVLAHPGASVRIVRSSAGVARGYAFSIALAHDTLCLLPENDPIIQAVRAALEMVNLVDLEEHWPDSNLFFMSTMALADFQDFAPVGAMTTDIAPTYMRGGAYLSVTSDPVFQSVLHATDHRVVGEFGTEPGRNWTGFVLDISKMGLAAWAEMGLSGKSPPPLPRSAALREEMQGLARVWDSDEAVAQSSIGLLAEPDPSATVLERAMAVRALVHRSFHLTDRAPSLESHILAAIPDVLVDLLSIRSERPAVSRSDEGAKFSVSQALSNHRGGGSVSTSGQTESSLTCADTAIGWSVRMLGGFSVIRDGHETDFGERIISRMIKVVALRGRIPAEELCELLWPEAPPGAGAVRLRSRLASLRRVTGGGLIERNGAFLVICPAVRVDVALFAEAAVAALTAVRRGDSGAVDLGCAALELYGGELLPADRYLDWTDFMREKLQRQYLAVLDFLAGEAASSGNIDRAINRLEEAIFADPYDEDRYVTAITLLVQCNMRPRALDMCRRARHMLATLGVNPSAALERAESALL